MMVDIACLYTSCECPSRRSSTQKLSNHVTTPCNLTPLTRKIVRGVLLLRTWFRKVSCRFCERSAAIVFVPFFVAGPFPRAYGQVACASLVLHLVLQCIAVFGSFSRLVSKDLDG